MTLVFSLLTFQTLLGALDTFWNHEYVERLPSRRGARLELALHAAREFVYVFLFLALAWREWRGAWALLIAGALLVEVVITSWDFVVEDRTRRLPVFERILHTVLTLMFGVVLMALAPVLFDWFQHPTAVTRHFIRRLLRAAHDDGRRHGGVGSARCHRRATPLPPGGMAASSHRIRGAPLGRAVLVTGGTGFIGGHVVRVLRRRGDSVWVWTRDADRALTRFGPHVHVVRQLARHSRRPAHRRHRESRGRAGDRPTLDEEAASACSSTAA